MQPKNRDFFGKLCALLTLANLLTSCAPQQSASTSSDASTQLNFTIKKPGVGRWVSGLAGVGGEALQLSEDFCYALHVTGEAPMLKRVAPARNVCATAPQGLGLFKGFFEKGVVVELEVPVGDKTRFDLVGYPKFLFENNVCPKGFEANPGTPGSNYPFIATAAGKKIDFTPQLIASAVTRVTLGENDITLIASADSALGVPYSCTGYPSVTVKDLTDEKKAAYRYVKNYPVGGICGNPGYPIKVTGDSNFEQSFDCKDDGTWGGLLDLSALADGTLKLNVRHRDRVGNWSEARVLELEKNAQVSLAFGSTWNTSAEAGAPLQSAAMSVTASDALGTLPIDGALALKAYTDVSCSQELSSGLASGSTPAVSGTGVVAQMTQGVASLTDINFTTQGAYYLRADAFGVVQSDCQGPITISGTYRKLTLSGITAQTTYTAGQAIANVTADLKNYYDQALQSSGDWTVQLKAYTDSACSTGAQVVASAALNDSTSTATFSSVSLDQTTYQAVKLGLMESGAPTVHTDCIPVMVSPDSGGALHLEVVTLPSTSVSAGSSFTVQAQLQDSYGNAVTASSNVPITLEHFPSSGSCSTGGTTITSSEQIAAASSVTSPIAVTLTQEATYYLKFSTSTSGIAASDCLDSVDITPAGPDHFQASFSTSAADAGETFDISVWLEDAYNNKVSTADTQSLSLSLYSDGTCSTVLGSSLQGGASVTISSSTHQADFSSRYVTKSGTVYFKASTGGAPLADACLSTSVVISPAVATQALMAFPGESIDFNTATVTGSPSTLSNLLPVTVNIAVFDAYGNLRSADVTPFTVHTDDPQDNESSYSGSLSSGQGSFALRHLWPSGNGVSHALNLTVGSLSPSANYTLVDICGLSASAAPFHAGSGTTNSPYVICTLSELQALSRDTAGAAAHYSENFILGADIDIAYSGGVGWSPIGSSATPFAGTFQGNNHEIQNFGALRAAEDEVGLFGYLESISTVKDLRITSKSLLGNNSVGILAGVALGTIRKVLVFVQSSGVTIGAQGDALGGLVGWQKMGIIENSGVAMSPGFNLIEFAGARGAGGLVGKLGGVNPGEEATVDTSYAYANLYCAGLSADCPSNPSQFNAMGGLIGEMYGANSVVKNSWARGGEILGNSEVGGVVGYMDDGGLVNSYATYTGASGIGSAMPIYSSPAFVGGLVGRVAQTSVNLQYVYTSGLKKNTGAGTYLKQGLLVGDSPTGWICSGPSTRSCVAEITSGISAAQMTGSQNNGVGSSAPVTNAYASTAGAMTSSATYTGWDMTFNSSFDYSSGPVWMKTTSTAPKLQWESTVLWDSGANAGPSVQYSADYEQVRQSLTSASTTRGNRGVSVSARSYWEYEIYPSSSTKVAVGVTNQAHDNSVGPGFDSAYRGLAFFQNATAQWSDTTYGTSSTPQSWGDYFGPGDVIGVWLDLTTSQLRFFKNGTDLGVAFSNLPAAGTLGYRPIVGAYATGTFDVRLNAGQRPFVTPTSTLNSLNSTWKSLNYLQ